MEDEDDSPRDGSKKKPKVAARKKPQEKEIEEKEKEDKDKGIKDKLKGTVAREREKLTRARSGGSLLFFVVS